MRERILARLPDVASWALIALLATRMAYVCLAVPMVGYANNLDFFREAACVGVWPDYVGQSKISSHLQNAWPGLVFDGDRHPDLCMASSDNLFPWAAAHLHRKHAHFSLRLVGALRAALTMVLALVLLAAPIGSRARLTLSAALFLVFGDIAILSYLNTLYVDFSGIAGTSLMLAAIIAIVAHRRPPAWLFVVVTMLVIFWLGNVKEQYQALAGVLGLLAALACLAVGRSPWRATCLGSAALAAPLLFALLNASPANITRSVEHIDIADTLFAAILPEAADKPAALATLGMPPACLAAIGGNGYRDDIAHSRLCPEVDRVSRLALLGLFVRQPATFFMPLLRAARLAQRLYLQDLTPFERPSDAEGLAFRVLKATSLSTYLAMLPVSAFVGLCSLSIMMAALTAFLPGWSTSFALAGLVICYSLTSSVFGDGYSEISRHAACIVVGMAFFLMAAAEQMGGRKRCRNWYSMDKVTKSP